MSAIAEKEFDRNLRPRERNRAFPKLALRQRSQEHSMVLFVLVVLTALSAMALVPPTGAAFTPFGISVAPATGQVVVEAGTVAGSAGSDSACHGQAWGAENAECLSTIARDSGVDGRKIRVIAGA